MYGLVLQGGGTKGSYHIGVWKALRELNIKIGAVTGTSIGALNGAFIAQNMYDEALVVWENIRVNDVIDADSEVYKDLMNFDFDYDNFEKYFGYFKKVISDKGLDTGPLRALIETHLDEETLRASDIDFGLVTISVSDMKPMELFVEDIPEGKLTDYLLASSFLPGFKPQELDGKRFVDGGMYDNLPINLITQKGYTDIIAVEMNSLGIKQKVDESNLNVTRISPSGDVGMMLQFDKALAKNNIEMGYLDTMKALGKYEGINYFFEDLPNESVFFDGMLLLEDANILAMAKDLGITSGNPKRVLFEKLVPELAKMFNLGEEDGYREIILTLVEYLGNLLKIDRLKVYKYEAFEKEVFEKAQAKKSDFLSYKDLPDFLKKSVFIKYSLRDEILIHWAKILVDSYMVHRFGETNLKDCSKIVAQINFK